jgi:hypothetical protein
MTMYRFGVLTLLMTGAALFAAQDRSFAQGGTTPQSPSMGSSRSGSAIDSDTGKGTSREAQSGATDRREFDQGFTGQPSGIGEQGSGQKQGTMERSGGQQSGSSSGHASSSDLQEGKTKQAMEQQSQEQTNR